jgi:hypothetical protein
MVNRSTCFEEAIGRASGVKVTVEKVELSRMEGSVCDLQVQELIECHSTSKTKRRW